MAVVGIDLGTTNTVIAAVRDGRATALKDKSGRALLPSVVSFGLRGTPKVGYPAKDRRTLDPENTVFSIKRLIGRTFDSEHVQKSIARYPFRLKEGPGKATMVSCHGQDHTLPEISALVLQEAATIAEQRLGEIITDAVITVPANFNDLQRAATKIAGRTAGLEVLRIINEPTAAALAYGFGKRGRERIVVYDFGGGTFDVTLLDLSQNVFEVLATAGDTFLGGDDVDRAIMDRMAEALLKEQKIDAGSDILVREQLRVAAENLKIELSTRSMAKTKIEDLEFEFAMRRSEFETLTEPLLERTLTVCQEALDIAGVFISDIDQVLLVGGSTRIPLVRRRVSSFFSKMPQSRINPDEVVAIGAAIQASTLEAKQGPTQVPAAPRPRRATSQSSRPPAALSGTKTGLAGLRQTLAGTGSKPESVSPQNSGTEQAGSLLSGLKSVATAGRVASPTFNPAQTLTGVGSLPSIKPTRPSADDLGPEFEAAPAKTAAGVGKPPPTSDEVQTREVQGNTNLGLGQAPDLPPTQLGAAPPRAVVPAPAGFPRKRPPPPAPALPPAADFAALGQSTSPAEEAELSLDEQMNRASARQSETPKDGDGSVTFDLNDLEEGPNSRDLVDFEDETTEIFDRNRALSEAEPERVGLATAPGGTALPDYLDAELPVPVSRKPAIEELSDSALFMLPEDEDEHGDLPTAVHHDSPRGHGQLVNLGRSAEESNLMSLRELAEDNNDELDLPSPASRPSASRRGPDLSFEESDRESDLPLPVVHAPSADLPTYQTSHRIEAGGLPAVSRGADLSKSRTTREQIGFGQTAPGFGQAAPGFGQTAPGFGQAAKTFGRSGSAGRPLDLGEPPPLEQPAAWGQSTQPGGSFDPSFPTRELMDSVAELDERSAAPLDPHTSFAPPPPGAIADGYSIPPAPTESIEHAVSDQSGRPLLLDVTPLSLGVEVVGGYVDRLIERNSPVPCQSTRTFATASDNQSVVRIRVGQGEDGWFDRNIVLGEVHLTGLSPGPRGSVKIDVSFSLDESGMLNVSARDRATGSAANARLMLAGVSE